MANRKHEIEEMDLPKEQKLELISQIKSSVSSLINLLFRKTQELKTTILASMTRWMTQLN